ncbi:hypothetical protein V3C99_003316 [Haemonchus contortus]
MSISIKAILFRNPPNVVYRGHSKEDARRSGCEGEQPPDHHSSPEAQDTRKVYNIEDIQNSDMDTVVDATDKESSHLVITPKIGQKIALVRHAETMNEAFPGWYSACVCKEQYNAKDLNHPVKLPLRSKGLYIYNLDPPITRLSEYAAKLLGKALASESGIKWDNVITAPELAAVQTGSIIASSTTGDKNYISIDESLCDLSHKKMDFMTTMELLKMDVSARVTQVIRNKESLDDSLGRVVGEIDHVQRSIHGNLIVVVGPMAFDAILCQLLGTPRTKTKKRKPIPQLASIILEKGPKSWNLNKKQVLPISSNYYAAKAFDLSAYITK